MIGLMNERTKEGHRGVTGTREFFCLWTERFGVDAFGNPIFVEGFQDIQGQNRFLPDFGDVWDPFPGGNGLFLRVDDIARDRLDAFDCKVTVSYSTQGQFGENFYEKSLEFACEVQNKGVTCHWASDGAPVDIPVAMMIPHCELVITIRMATSPFDAIFTATGCLNDRIFQGSPVGTLLFLGASVRENWDVNGVLMNCLCSYKFSRKNQDWNLNWRPRTQRVAKGIPQLWSKDYPGNLDPANGQSYNLPDIGTFTAAQLNGYDSTPVYVGQTLPTDVVTETIGSVIYTWPGWDSAQNPDGSFGYAYVNLASVLGLPIADGDDSP
jgi:hypothetical protein